MYVLVITFILFMIYSLIGWCIESVGFTFIFKKFTNRGFLIGPYCPIYGVAAMLMVFTLGKYKNDQLILFVMSILIASLVEYITSFLMEKIFRTRWWDYSHRTFNINGRVCLLNSLCFGVLGVFLIKLLNPIIIKHLLLLPVNNAYILSIIILLIFITDIVLSCNIIIKLKKTANMLKKDCTNEVGSRVRRKIIGKSKLFLRLDFAFPNYQFLPKEIKKKVNKYKKKKRKH